MITFINLGAMCNPTNRAIINDILKGIGFSNIKYTGNGLAVHDVIDGRQIKERLRSFIIDGMIEEITSIEEHETAEEDLKQYLKERHNY